MHGSIEARDASDIPVVTDDMARDAAVASARDAGNAALSFFCPDVTDASTLKRVQQFMDFGYGVTVFSFRRTRYNTDYQPPWPNVPLALSQGTFDAFVSTDESCNSAKLWEAGVKYSYADRQFMGQYIPQLGNATWAKLKPNQQKLMTDLWAEHIDGYRKNAAASQLNGRKVMEQNGVKFTDPAADELAATRKAMLGDVDALIKDAKLSPEIVKLVKEALG